uniref:Uncharacterized protein n=1 Tax=Knipowitschia caucasica TaxID=637954 RepID=A0AAV2KP67_KNICA
MPPVVSKTPATPAETTHQRSPAPDRHRIGREGQLYQTPHIDHDTRGSPRTTPKDHQAPASSVGRASLPQSTVPPSALAAPPSCDTNRHNGHSTCAKAGDGPEGRLAYLLTSHTSRHRPNAKAATQKEHPT